MTSDIVRKEKKHEQRLRASERVKTRDMQSIDDLFSNAISSTKSAISHYNKRGANSFARDIEPVLEKLRQGEYYGSKSSPTQELYAEEFNYQNFQTEDIQYIRKQEELSQTELYLVLCKRNKHIPSYKSPQKQMSAIEHLDVLHTLLAQEFGKWFAETAPRYVYGIPVDKHL